MTRKQIEELIADMTLEEKVLQLVQVPGSAFEQDVEDTGTDTHLSLGTEKLAMVGSTLGIRKVEKLNQIQKSHLEQSPHRIPLLFMMDVIHGLRTVFPMPLALGATFDPDLAEEGARIAAKESAVTGIHVTFSPMVDVSRDARWGRIMESPGEDPYLNSCMARAHVLGFQGRDPLQDAAPYKDHVSACIKHYAAYGAAEAGRDYNTTELSDHTLREYYLPPYKEGVRAGADMVMTSFNSWNGETTSASRYLLQKILREEWGFEGVVISDWNAIGELVEHGLCEDLRGAAKLAIEAGVDIDMCSGAYAGYLAELVRSGEVAEDLVDASVRRVLLLKNKLGLFENPYKDCDPEAASQVILCEEHRQAARRAVHESSVLLKNQGLLPLKKGQKILLTGPYLHEKELHSIWAIAGRAEDNVSVYEAAGEHKADYEFLYADGCRMTHREDLARLSVETLIEDTREGKGFCGADALAADPALLKEAAEKASAADGVVVLIGESRNMSGESGSRGDITVPRSQIDLLRTAAQANPNVTAVIFTGRPLDLREVCTFAKAVLVVWLPGCEGGHGIMDLLTGEAVPSGKLPATMPYSAAQLPIYYNHLSTGRAKPYGVQNPMFTSCYMDMPNRPLYPFGYGLSYTTFMISPVNLNRNTVRMDDLSDPSGACLKASVTVTNTGTCTGTEVVQLYIHDCVSSLVRPVRELKDFCRVTLAPGEEKQVSFEITREMLSFTGHDGNPVIEPGTFEIWVGNSSETANRAEFILA